LHSKKTIFEKLLLLVGETKFAKKKQQKGQSCLSSNNVLESHPSNNKIKIKIASCLYGTKGKRGRNGGNHLGSHSDPPPTTKSGVRHFIQRFFFLISKF
jgi:hypothetical protein